MKLFFAFLFLIYSCGDDDFKKYSKLENLRVLAIKADQPEINVPTTVALSPFLSNTNGGDTTIEIEYTACIDPGISFGADLNCENVAPSLLLSGSQSFNTSTFGPSNFYTGEGPVVLLNIPPSYFAFLDTLSPDIQFNGLDVLVFLSFRDTKSGQTVDALKRISLTTKVSDLNTNPQISGTIQVNSANLSAFPSQEVELLLSGLSAPTTYAFNASSGRELIEEQMLITWFSNEGEFKVTRSIPGDSVKYDPKGASSGVFVAVYRDGRGGVDVHQIVLP